MYKREKRILEILADGGCRSADSIAEKLNTGTKTVRNLIKEMNQELETNGAQILSKYGSGYHLSIQDQDLFDTYCKIRAKSTLDTYLPSTSEERVQYLLEYLCNSNKYVKLDNLSDSLYISKRTLTSDMKEVEALLSKYNIVLKRKPNYGIRIEGKEFDVRLCIASFSGKRLHKGNQSMDEIAGCVNAVLRENDFSLTGAAYQNLVVHLYIAISRLMEGHHVPMPEGEIENTLHFEEYEIAKKLAERIEETFCITFPESEVAYIAIHLAGKELLKSKTDKNVNLVISQEISDLVTKMLEKVYESFKFDFRDDLELRMILSQHLVPLSVRVKYDMELKNPLLRDVKEKFCLAYTMACDAVTVLNEYFQVFLSEDEIAYFAFAFALALERRKTEIQKKNVLLVCASGRGSAQLMLYKYQRTFGNYIDKMQACDVGNLYKIDFSEYDYIFTTVPIAIKVPIPIQEVEYFMNDSDMDCVKKALTQNRAFSVDQYYPGNLFLPHLPCKTKAEVLDYMCHYAIGKRNLPEAFYQSVLDREKLAITAFGNGVAMPHSNKAMSSETFVCVGILDEPVEWGNQMIQAVFLVSLANKDQSSAELQRFYQMTATFLLSSKQIQRLVKKRDYDLMIQALEEIEGRM